MLNNFDKCKELYIINDNDINIFMANSASVWSTFQQKNDRESELEYKHAANRS